VGMTLEGAGFEVIDLGVDVPPERFVEAIREHSPFALGLSALLTTTMLAMEQTIREIESSGIRSQVKILVGGAPVTQAYADEIGADCFGKDPQSGKVFLQELCS